MATLILSTVGTVLGGPVGGAIGALVGQSIDQQLLGPGPRGPKLGDLSVQSSSYGTEIPRVYGTMRVAGSVIWATDLVQSTTTTGAKGQPDTTSSYSVSFAVALSSRQANSIKRIWADGKILRGQAGDFSVSTVFRYYDGDEDQAVDPLIASVEGLANTPAYRGLALAVFEDLELADYGNRIPFLTFECAADESDAPIPAILEDSSAGLIRCTSDQSIIGYAAYGSSIKSAVEPLTTAFSIDLFDDGEMLRSPASAPPVPVSDDDLGNSADSQAAAKIQRDQASGASLPATLTLNYYDPDRDYQTGQARASAGDEGGNEDRIELPAVISAGVAKSLAQQLLMRRWAKRDKLTLRLPPRDVSIEPGAVVAAPLTPSLWSVERCTIDGFVVVAELRPWWNGSTVIAADAAIIPAVAGRVAASSDLAPSDVTLALFEVPDLSSQPTDNLTLSVAASSDTARWRPCTIQVETAQGTTSVRSASRKTALGQLITPLGPGQPYLIDTENSFDVQLIDPDQWLMSCDDEALVNGANLAVAGDELLQFADVTPIAPGRFRLQRLLRGRGGTEWAAQAHSVGETFALLEANAFRLLQLPAAALGSTVKVSTVSAPGQISSPVSAQISGEALRPPSPVGLQVEVSAGGDLKVSWVRRSRAGWFWIDNVDAPIGESREAYRVSMLGSRDTLEIECDTSSLLIARATLLPAGLGATTVQVRQIGDWNVSHAAEAAVTLI